MFFLTGTDEHGNKVAQAAEERGLTPREHVDRLAPQLPRDDGPGGREQRLLHPHDRRRARGLRAALRREAAGRRRHREAHLRRSLLHRLRGLLLRARPRRRPVPDPPHRAGLARRRELLLPALPVSGAAREFYRAHPGWVRPRSRYNEALSFIEQGLEDISISRKSITWGIPVPWDPEQVIYVWVDALINYISALTYARPGDDLEQRYWPADLHFWPRTSSSSTPYLAGPALERRLRGAACRVHPRLPADGRREDEQDARQRARSLRRDRTARPRRPALLPVPRGDLRPGRRDQPRGFRAALQQRARQRARQPGEPGRVDGRQVSRRSPAGGAARVARRVSPARARPWWRRRASSLTGSRSRRPSRRSGSSSAGSTATSRKRRPGSSPRTRAWRAASTLVLHGSGGRPASRGAHALSGRARHRRRDPASAGPGPRDGRPAARARPLGRPGGGDVVAAPPLFPRIEAEA